MNGLKSLLIQIKQELNEFKITHDLIILDSLRIHLGKIDSEFTKIKNDQFLSGIFKIQNEQEVQDYFTDKILGISAIIICLDNYRERLSNYHLTSAASPAEKMKYELSIRLCGTLFKDGKDNFLEIKENLQSKINNKNYKRDIDAYKKMANSFCSTFFTLKEYTKIFDSVNFTSNIYYLQKITDIDSLKL